MKVSAIKCLECGDTVFSRARHDMRWCSCRSCYIDGGRDYCRMGGDPDYVEVLELEVEQTEQELYDDWNKLENKYGIIEPSAGNDGDEEGA